MIDETCIFCKLANGMIPTNTVYEDEEFRIILDANPATKGHSLILPKNHFKDIYEIDAKTAGKATQLAKKLATHMSATLKCEGVNLLQNNGEAAGQTVFHFHMHVIPRYDTPENAANLSWKQQTFSDEEMKEILETLKMEE